MNKALLSVPFALALAGAASAEPVFPYAADLSDRYRSEGEMTSEDGVCVDVPEVSPMPSSDSIVTSHIRYGGLHAIEDEEIWTKAAEAARAAQAALVVRRTHGEDGTVDRWMGIVGGATPGLVELTGPAIGRGLWEAEIDIDYTRTPTRIRYRVRENPSDVWSVLTAEGTPDGWFLSGNAEAFRLSAVQICGDGTVDSVVASSGRREGEAEFRGTMERFSFDYDRLALDVSVGDVWSMDALVVTLISASGTVAVTNELTPRAVNTIDVSGLIRPGERYVYEVSAIGTYRGASFASGAGESALVAAAADDGWFGFWDGGFVNAVTNGGFRVAEGTFAAALSTNAAVMSAATPCAGTTNLSADVTVECGDAYDWYELAGLGTDGSQGSLVLAETDENVRTWACWDAADREWKALSADGVGTADGTYRIRAEFDYAAKKVRYSVRVGDALKVLADSAGATWFALPADAEPLSTVAFRGEADYSRFTVGYVFSDRADAARIDGATRKIRLLGNAVLDLSDADIASGEYAVENIAGKRVSYLAWTDSGSRYAVRENGKLTIVEGVPANGRPSYASYVLGLDPADADRQPMVDFVRDAETDTFRLTLLNVQPRSEAETGVRVKFALEQSDDVRFGESEVGEDADVPEFTVPIPDAPSRFYRIKIRLVR